MYVYILLSHSTGQTRRDAPTHPVDLISLDDNEVNGAAVLIPVPALGPSRPLEQQQVESQQVEPRQNDMRQVEPRQNDMRQVEPRQNDMRQVEPRQNDMRQVEPRQNDMRQAAPRQNERGVQNGMLLNIVSPTYQQGGTTDNALSPGDILNSFIVDHLSLSHVIDLLLINLYIKTVTVFFLSLEFQFILFRLQV
jgi:hypothetical protein